MCYSFGENTSIGFTQDPFESMTESNLKEEYRLLFNQMRDHYKNLSVLSNRSPTAPATRKLTVTCIKSRGKVENLIIFIITIRQRTMSNYLSEVIAELGLKHENVSVSPQGVYAGGIFVTPIYNGVLIIEPYKPNRTEYNRTVRAKLIRLITDKPMLIQSVPQITSTSLILSLNKRT